MNTTVTETDNQVAEITPYNPIHSVSLPGAGRIDLRGLIIVVGPNSSGKTLFLRDLVHALSPNQEDLVVCSDVILSKPPNVNDFIDELVARGDVIRRDRGTLWPAKPHCGLGTSPKGALPMQPLVGLVDKLSDGFDPQAGKEAKAFLELISPYLSTVLFIENRVSAIRGTSNFDPNKQVPANETQALFYDEKAQRELAAETMQVFGKHIWVDPTTSAKLIMRARDGAPLPDENLLHPPTANKYRTLEQEGDGLRSYVTICLCAMLGRRPVCVIDEPELCLHPPQARAIGRFIGHHSADDSRTMIVATHSSHVLRGILDSQKNATVIRLSRKDGVFSAHEVKPGEMANHAKPQVRREALLDGLFADAVTIVEADTDRIVYEAAAEKLPRRIDNLFLPVGGLGGIASAAQFFRQLGIPVAVVADLDLVTHPKLLYAVTSSLGAAEDAERCQEACASVADALSKLRPQISESDLDEKRAILADKSLDWLVADNEDVRRTLRALARDLDPIQRLHRGGLESFQDNPALRGQLHDLIAQCSRLGLFLVPVGEIEYWGPGVVATSRKKKAAWATEFAEHIRESTEQLDVEEFVAQVVKHHEAALGRESSQGPRSPQ